MARIVYTSVSTAENDSHPMVFGNTSRLARHLREFHGVKFASGSLGDLKSGATTRYVVEGKLGGVKSRFFHQSH